MSHLSHQIGQVLSIVHSACQHDIDRWQRALKVRQSMGHDTSNPHCYQCEEGRDRTKRREAFKRIPQITKEY